MISLIIPTYRNPKCLDICLISALGNQDGDNEIIVVVDGYLEESINVLRKYKSYITIIAFEQNKGLQTGTNTGVSGASSSKICVINDDNVLCKNWDSIIEEDLADNMVLTINQIERTPSIFHFPIKDLGGPDNFRFQEFINYEPSLRKPILTDDGGIMPFAMFKKDFMIVGGWDVAYPSPYVVDWDFFLKLELNGKKFARTHKGHFYHFGSVAIKSGVDNERISATEAEGRMMFMNKWGISPQLFKNNSHCPKGSVSRGIKF